MSTVEIALIIIFLIGVGEHVCFWYIFINSLSNERL
jgi:hypothetical protein